MRIPFFYRVRSARTKAPLTLHNLRREDLFTMVSAPQVRTAEQTASALFDDADQKAQHCAGDLVQAMAWHLASTGKLGIGSDLNLHYPIRNVPWTDETTRIAALRAVLTNTTGGEFSISSHGSSPRSGFTVYCASPRGRIPIVIVQRNSFESWCSLPGPWQARLKAHVDHEVHKIVIARREREREYAGKVVDAFVSRSQDETSAHNLDPVFYLTPEQILEARH